jgi:hypothetical protein
MKQKCLGRGSGRKIKVFGNGPMREETKGQHVGKLPLSIHGKLPIEGTSHHMQQTKHIIFRNFFNTMHSWSYRCLAGLWFGVEQIG